MESNTKSGDARSENMGMRGRKIQIFVFLLILSLTGIWISGCSTFKTKTSSRNAQASKEKEQKGPMPLYYDFGDVLVPSELKVVKKSSFVFRTPGLSAGVLSLKGRVEIGSLIAFFDTNMAKDNWELVSSFKSQRSIMLFHKENRWCVINISESEFSTYVEIWVSPTTSEAGIEPLKGS